MDEQKIEAAADKWYSWSKLHPYFTVGVASFIVGWIAAVVVRHL